MPSQHKTIILQPEQKTYHTLAVKNQTDLFRKLRKEFPFLAFQKYTLIQNDSGYQISFFFNLSNKYRFNPVIQIPRREFFASKPDDVLLHQIAFNIGMVELISYWKAACSPVILIEPFQLNEEQIQWWKKLYYLGLGEFFYTNGIQVDPENFVTIESKGSKSLSAVEPSFEDTVVVPVGGGKDSVVTLEILRKLGHAIRPMIVNPRGASSLCAQVAGFTENETIIIHRTIDAQLLELNAKGFLNGHTPFSALLAFVSAFTAVLNNSKYVALSNESSANEPTVPGTEINHQYSKSLEFEKDFRDYLQKNISSKILYFSFLRPLNELQITAYFSQLTAYHPVFKSCNAGSKTNSWCGKCPKCLFTFTMLSPFVESSRLKVIFGKNLLNDAALLPVMNELAGLSPVKPFECVGTTEEVNIALNYLATNNESAGNLLIKIFSDKIITIDKESVKNDLNKSLNTFDQQHFLPEGFEKLIQQTIHELPNF